MRVRASAAGLALGAKPLGGRHSRGQASGFSFREGLAVPTPAILAQTVPHARPRLLAARAEIEAELGTVGRWLLMPGWSELTGPALPILLRVAQEATLAALGPAALPVLQFAHEALKSGAAGFPARTVALVEELLPLLEREAQRQRDSGEPQQPLLPVTITSEDSSSAASTTPEPG